MFFRQIAFSASMRANRFLFLLILRSKGFYFARCWIVLDEFSTHRELFSLVSIKLLFTFEICSSNRTFPHNIASIVSMQSTLSSKSLSWKVEISRNHNGVEWNWSRVIVSLRLKSCILRAVRVFKISWCDGIGRSMAYTINSRHSMYSVAPNNPSISFSMSGGRSCCQAQGTKGG